MNILEAHKASNCGKIRRPSWPKDDFIERDYDVVSLLEIFKDDWEPISEPLTFERIRKECVPGQTLLVDNSVERLYLGFNRVGYLVTDLHDGGYSTDFKENEIKDWTIGGKFERGEG